MPVLAPDRAREIVAGWRRSAEATDGFDNPAGGLYTSGAFAEADILQFDAPATITRSVCTGSCGTFCCA